MHFDGPGLPFPAAVVFGFDPSGSPDPADLAEVIHGGWTGSILEEQNAACDLVGCTVKLGPNSTGASGTFSSTETGGNAESGCTPNVAILVTKNTGLGGRRGRGRMYIPGVTEDGVGAVGQLAEATQEAFQDQCNAFLVLMTLAGLPVVLLHSDATTPTAVTSLSVSNRVATQRRRLRR
jgi:hypothetical protein